MLAVPTETATLRTTAHARPRAAAGVQPFPWLVPGVFLGSLTPLASIALRITRGGLDANPIAQIENELGLAALIFLVASLACTPLRRVTRWTWPVRIRRELGLFAFFYAGVHVLVYLLVDQGLDVTAVVADIVKRPFITVGFLALVLMVPLAVTSTRASVRRLGFRRWQRLHQLAYLAGVLGVVHFIWRVKSDISQPLVYACALGVLLGLRAVFWFFERRRPAVRPRATSAGPIGRARANRS
jgi:sulfoxide reductase heme-binding subunit YedZ